MTILTVILIIAFIAIFLFAMSLHTSDPSKHPRDEHEDIDNMP